MQTVGPRDLCFSVDLPFGGDKLVILREVLVCMGRVAEVWICPRQQAASGQEVGRSDGAAWTRPKTGCVGKNQRHLIWSLSLKKRKYQNRPKFVSWE